MVYRSQCRNIVIVNKVECLTNLNYYILPDIMNGKLTVREVTRHVNANRGWNRLNLGILVCSTAT